MSSLGIHRRQASSVIGKQLLFHIGAYFFTVKFKEEVHFEHLGKSERYDFFYAVASSCS